MNQEEKKTGLDNNIGSQEEPELKGYAKTLILSLVVGIAFVALGGYLVSLFPSGLWLLGLLLLLIGGVDLLVYIPFGVIPCLKKEKGWGKESKEAKEPKASKGPPKALKIIVLIVVLVSIAVLIIVVARSQKLYDDNGMTDSYGHSVTSVWSDAKDVVSAQLKAPSSAEFCSMSDGKVTVSGDTWTVSGTVDAQNSFGTTLRNDYTVVLRFTSKYDYEILSCDIV